MSAAGPNDDEGDPRDPVVDPAGRFEVHATRQLHQPVLVVALEGWVDAGLGAATAVAALQSASRTELLVSFDGERFLDQRARRPTARIVNGVTRELRWPRTEIRAGADRNGLDMLFLVGPEPDFHWRDFVDAVIGLSLHWGVRMMVGLGAFPAPAPHTRPVKLAATAPERSEELVARVGSSPASSRCRRACWPRSSWGSAMPASMP